MSRLPIQRIIQNFGEINQKLADSSSTEELIKLSKEQKKLGRQYELAAKIAILEKAVGENDELLEVLENSEVEMLELAKEDNLQKKQQLEICESELLTLLSPSDERDDNDILIEIRAGAGGDESSLFAAEILKSYIIMAQKLGLNAKIISTSENSLGGFKEVICEIRGSDSFAWYKYEGGVHRVQRVPVTEKQGRVHTSTISVAILPLIENDSHFKLDMKEVELIASTSQGAGGQSVNTTYSAIKAKHLPTGIEAQCQDERNQQQNKIKALQILTSRVFNFYEEERLAKEGAARREQVGTAERSEKIRTYNFPQDRLTDHRYNRNWSQLPVIMSGGILDIVREIKKMEAERSLERLGETD